jgi:hypothetical protein
VSTSITRWRSNRSAVMAALPFDASDGANRTVPHRSGSPFRGQYPGKASQNGGFP